METYRLFTVTTNSFNTFDVISTKSQDELEFDYKGVIDKGAVTNVTTSMQSGNVLFKHNGWMKKLSYDRKID